MHAVAGVLPAQVIVIAGKTVRGAHDRANGKAALHLVSAWASANRLVLAQVTVDATSNELTAIPELLRVVALEGCLVTIEALGCQREIAWQSSEQGGAYFLARKGNQETRYYDVVALVADAQAKTSAEVVVDEHRRVNKGHGRIEVRHWRVSSDPDVLAWLQDRQHWPGLQAIGMVEAERRRECRYYLLSAHLTATVFGTATHSHWGGEHRVQWVLDVVFHDDQRRIRQGHAAENVAGLRQQQAKRLSIRGKRLKAGWDHGFLLQIIKGV